MAQLLKKIEKKNNGKILIELNRASASKNSDGVVKKNEKVTSDLMPHGDLLRAMERMTPHLLLAFEFADPTYFLIDKEFPMDKAYFDKWEWRDDPRFEGLTLTSVLVVGKEAADGIYLIGTKETSIGGISKPFRTPLISLLKEPENNYPLQAIIDAQFETLVTEALEYHSELKFAPDPQMELWDEATSLEGGKSKMTKVA